MAGRSATQVIDFSSPVRSQHKLARFVWLAVFGALFVIGLFVIATSAYEASVPHRSPISVELREGEFLVRRNDTPEPIREWDRLIVLGGVVLDGTASQLDEVVDDLPPQIEYEAVFERGSRERIRAVLTLENGTVFTPVIAALLTLLAPFGWLAVASRGNDARGRREFLFLAAATSALLLPMVPTSWREIGRPFNGLEYGSGSDWAYFYFLALWPVLYGLFLGRFLITVAGDPQGRERWLFGGRLILLTTVASLLGFATTYPFLEMAGFSLFVGLLLVLLLASSLLRGRSPLALAVTICLPFLGVATLILIRDVQVGVSLRTMIAEIEIIIGIVLVTGAGISAVLALIYWPLTILRLARS